MENAASVSTTLLTPVSELVFGNPTDIDLLFARHGNDTIYGEVYNEGNIQEIDYDFLFGDMFDTSTADIEVLSAILFEDNPLKILETGPLPGWSDTFVLGDWTRPYYIEKSDPFDLLNTNFFGFNELAFVYDFNPAQDLIQLHGQLEDYFLLEVNNLDVPEFGGQISGEIIFSLGQGIPDIIGFILSTPEIQLSLEADYFRFVGDSPPIGPLNDDIVQLGTLGLDLAFQSAVDVLGNTYVTGITSGSLGEQNNGNFDFFLAKYDINGEPLWLQQYGSSQLDMAASIGTDFEGNIYLAGTTSGDLFEPLESEQQDTWLAKYNSNGTLLWSQQFGTDLTGGEISGSLSLDVDYQGNAYLSGVSVKENQRTDLFDFVIQDDAWVTKFNGDGNLEWFTTIGSTTELGSAFFDESYGVTVDQQGNVYATGWTQGILSLSDPSRVEEGTGRYDVWLSKLNPAGEIEWIEQFGSENDGLEFAWDVETDSQDNIYVTGWTLGNLAGENAGAFDIFLAKYRPDGSQAWVQQFGSEGDEGTYLTHITVDSSDNIYLVGQTNNSLDGQFNAGSFDAWITKFDSEGNQQWIRQFGSPNLDYATSITFNPINNDLIVTGFTDGSLGDWNAGATDAWIARFESEFGILQAFEQTLEDENIETNFRVAKANENVLIATAEEDKIQNFGRHHTIAAELGNNFIERSDRDVLLQGGLSNDTQTEEACLRGQGADPFGLAAGQAIHPFVDVEMGGDSLSLAGGLTANELSVNPLENHNQMNLGNDILALLNGVNPNDLIANNLLMGIEF